ncbi:MAG: DUF547 domain-containing protein [Acidobacteria bacterium]|nr:DUF547 domain-containing protein [Acidobacteriota bacterium]
MATPSRDARSFSGAQSAAQPPTTAQVEPFDHEHRAWTAILATYDSSGGVDYEGLLQRGQPALDVYLDALAAAVPDERGWTRPERMAYWINAYNAFTVRLVLDHYPLKSIRSIGFLPYAAFRKSFIPLGADGKKISLNTIENDVLRTQFADPRVHFALVCASKGCPALRSEAYRADVLDAELDDAARRFLADTSKNQWDAASRTLRLSSIFRWYREDFERAAGTVPQFVARYAPPAMAGALAGTPPRIAYLEYDWSLNGRE